MCGCVLVCVGLRMSSSNRNYCHPIGPGGGVLHLKSVSEGNLLQEEFVRDAPNR